MRNRSRFHDLGLIRVLMIAAAAIVFAGAPFSSAPAYTLKTLHSFCSWFNCTDGWGMMAEPKMSPKHSISG